MATALTALMRSDARLADWPALARYREANRTVQPPAANEQRVVFMGDSITDAWQQPILPLGVFAGALAMFFVALSEAREDHRARWEKYKSE